MKSRLTPPAPSLHEHPIERPATATVHPLTDRLRRAIATWRDAGAIGHDSQNGGAR